MYALAKLFYALFLSTNSKLSVEVTVGVFSLIWLECPVGVIMSAVIKVIVEEQTMPTKVCLQTCCDVSSLVSVWNEPVAACTSVAWFVRLWCHIKAKEN